MKTKIIIIVAASQNGVIGKDNQLIWRLSSDLKRFKTLTTGHSIIMGRKTFDSIGKPLPNRRSIVLSKQKDYKIEGCEVVHGLEKAFDLTKKEAQIFILGGAKIYELALPFADEIFLTRVETQLEGDAFFPEINPEFWEIKSEEKHLADEKNEYDYTFIHFLKKGKK